jgi:hypothetical protein
MPTTVVLLVPPDALSAHQPPTALPVSPLPLPQEADHVPVPTKLTSPFLLMEFVIALPVDLTVKTVLMPTLAQPVSLHTQRLSTTNASAQPSSLLTVKATVSPVQMAAKTAPQPPSATAASVLLSSKAVLAKPAATTDSLHLDHLVLAVLSVVSNVPRTWSATTVLTTTTNTMGDATPSALLELLVIRPEATGSVLLATHLARLASITPHTAPAVLTEWATFKPQLSNSHVCYHVSMVPLFKKEFARFATSAVPLALDQPLTVSHAQLVKSFMQEDVGLLAPPSATLLMDSMRLAVTSVPMAITRYLTLSVPHAHLSAQPATLDLVIVPLAYKDQSQ